MSIPTLKTRLKDLMYKDLTHNWSLCSFAKITHLIHRDWLPRKLPVSMHSRFSHVIYNCLAVNRAPFRSWLHKIKRADSKQCRFGCQCDETSLHVLFNCPLLIHNAWSFKRNVVMKKLTSICQIYWPTLPYRRSLSICFYHSYHLVNVCI